uniref:Uncharacterized protein n=1 Tax=Peronospora matthiolae TaxID=2874970 RepID=A0AAV1VBV8_9STRA
MAEATEATTRRQVALPLLDADRQHESHRWAKCPQMSMFCLLA